MKNAKGLYVDKSGKSYPMLEGSRVQVYRGVAYKTSGGLTKKNLFKNKRGRYVSLKKHKTAKKDKRLEKAGYKTQKGKFGSTKTSKKAKTGKKSKTGKKAKTGKKNKTMKNKKGNKRR